jgi:hypothetical protein
MIISSNGENKRNLFYTMYTSKNMEISVVIQ